MRIISAAFALIGFALPVHAAEVDDRTAIAFARPQELIVDRSLAAADLAAMLKPVDAFYGFWNNGSQDLLDAAIAPSFSDHTLPPGRPQGPAGPAAASKAFRSAVPDLRCTVVQRLVVGDRVVTHMRFSGHFTGTFEQTKGEGQPIDFIATDILRVRDGHITDNWHIEDNFAFLRQAGLLQKSAR